MIDNEKLCINWLIEFGSQYPFNLKRSNVVLQNRFFVPNIRSNLRIWAMQIKFEKTDVFSDYKLFGNTACQGREELASLEQACSVTQFS